MEFLEYDSCILCPRNCYVNRNKGEKGFCKQGSSLIIAWAGLHFGEEPPITHKGGSGAIFITGCNLACSFCQNYQISKESMGLCVTPETFSSICLKLKEKGAENINIVTGSHHTLPILRGLSIAKNKNLNVPIVWNTSSYEKVSEIQRLSSSVNIWLPDLKTLDSSFSTHIFKAPDYPNIAKNAILKMVELSPIKYDVSAKQKDYGTKLISGVIVRHLAIPGKLKDTENIIKWFSENLKNNALLSIMTQYTPIRKNEEKNKVFIDRYITEGEDECLKELLYKYDIEEGFYQELIQDSSWLPDFEKTQPFSSNLSKPIWHWSKGFLV